MKFCFRLHLMLLSQRQHFLLKFGFLLSFLLILSHLTSKASLGQLFQILDNVFLQFIFRFSTTVEQDNRLAVGLTLCEKHFHSLLNWKEHLLYVFCIQDKVLLVIHASVTCIVNINESFIQELILFSILDEIGLFCLCIYISLNDDLLMLI